MIANWEIWLCFIIHNRMVFFLSIPYGLFQAPPLTWLQQGNINSNKMYALKKHTDNHINGKKDNQMYLKWATFPSKSMEIPTWAPSWLKERHLEHVSPEILLINFSVLIKRIQLNVFAEYFGAFGMNAFSWWYIVHEPSDPRLTNTLMKMQTWQEWCRGRTRRRKNILWSLFCWGFIF